MSRSKEPEHPLILRLRVIMERLQSITETDKLMRKGVKGQAAIKGFYEGAIQNGSLAAKLIDAAIKQFPITPVTGARKGGRS